MHRNTIQPPLEKGPRETMKMYCDKTPYQSKKEAKRAAKALSRKPFGGYAAKFSCYHCKDCNSWHMYTRNRSQMRHNSQHARGGRGRRRRVRT